MREVASKHSKVFDKRDLPENVSAKPVRVRDYLEKGGLLVKKEVSAIAAIYCLLSETCGHPYQARNDQARLLRHYALTTSQFVMLRLEEKIKTQI